MGKLPNAVIVAPPGAGKSTYAKTNPLAVDADQHPAIKAVYKHLFKEFGPGWWNVPKANATKLYMMSAAFKEAYASLKPGQVLLTAEYIALEDAPDYVRKFVVVPEIGRYLANHVARKKDPSQRFNWTTKSDADALMQLDKYHDYAIRFNATEVADFTSVKRS